MNHTAANHACAPSPERRSLPVDPKAHVAAAEELALVSLSARLLFENGQSTEKVMFALGQLADAMGFRATVFPRWGELTVLINDANGSRHEILAFAPVGVDMRKVAATIEVIDDICSGHFDAAAARSALETIARFPSVSTARFALLAAAGAAALGVIFGATHMLGLLLIAISAGTGASLRRWLSGVSRDLFIQPLCAALLAGVVGAITVRLQLSSALRLIAVCPCMILVPGPHLLNGTLDLARARIALGASRIAYAGTIILMICTGLLTGLSFGSVSLPIAAASHPVPLGCDVIAAGVAVAAYGTFFAMPWRMLPIPVAIGMLAHATRWGMISLAGASVEIGALAACLVVGIIVTPIVDRLRLPFAAFAFASVVSLIPGVYLFRMAGGLIDLATLGEKASVDMLLNTIADGTTAILIILAMAIGLILPKMCIEHFDPDQPLRPMGKPMSMSERRSDVIADQTKTDSREDQSLRSKPMQSRNETVSDVKVPRLSSWDVAYALNMAIACLITYWMVTHILSRFVDRPSDLLGGMWAVAATVFVFRETRRRSLSAGADRLIATCVSFALCLLYLLLFPFTPVGMAALIAIGTVVMALLGRRDDIVTVGITTVVVMVVAAMSPVDAWQQPVLRLADTIVGIGVGVACKGVASFLFSKSFGEHEGA